MDNQIAISFVGAGNVAWHLTHALQEAGIPVFGIYSRSDESAKRLAEEVGAHYIESLDTLSKNSDFIFICTPDDVIPEIASKLYATHAIVAHTSGVADLRVVGKFVSRAAVFYPLNSFTRGIPADLNETPIFVETVEPRDLELVKAIAGSLSSNVRLRKDYDMKYLHLAAVFANNFSNAMIGVADAILQEHNAELEVLMPLIRQTIKKLDYSSPMKGQTGPAIRHDDRTLDHHLQLLSEKPDIQKIYRLVSKFIQQAEKNENH